MFVRPLTPAMPVILAALLLLLHPALAAVCTGSVPSSLPGRLYDGAGVEILAADLAFLRGGDLDGDGTNDLIGIRRNGNRVYAWRADGAGVFSLRWEGALEDDVGAAVPAEALKVVVVGDMDGDGAGEIAGFQRGTTWAYIWSLDGAACAPHPMRPEIAQCIFRPEVAGDLVNSIAAPVYVDALRFVEAGDFMGNGRSQFRGFQSDTAWNYTWGLERYEDRKFFPSIEGPLLDHAGDPVPVDSLIYATATRDDPRVQNTPGPAIILAMQDHAYAWGTAPGPLWDRPLCNAGDRCRGKSLLFGLDQLWSNGLVATICDASPCAPERIDPEVGAALDRVVETLGRFATKYAVYAVVAAANRDRGKVRAVLDRLCAHTPPIPFVLDAYSPENAAAGAATPGFNDLHDPAHGFAHSAEALQALHDTYGSCFAGLRMSNVIGTDYEATNCYCRTNCTPPSGFAAEACARPLALPEPAGDPFYTRGRMQLLADFAAAHPPMVLIVSGNEWPDRGERASRSPYPMRLAEFLDDAAALARTRPIVFMYANDEGVDRTLPRNYRLKNWHLYVQGLGAQGFGLANGSRLCDGEPTFTDVTCPREEIALWASDAFAKGARYVQLEPFWYFFTWPRGKREASESRACAPDDRDCRIDWSAAGTPTANLDYLAQTLGIGSPVAAAAQTIRGRTLTIKDPAPGEGGNPAKREILVAAREPASADTLDAATILANGATLTIATAGANPTRQTFVLPSSRWSLAARRGAKVQYSDAKGAIGPVESVVVKKSRRGVFTLDARIVGRLGPGAPPSIVVVPPGPGSSASAVLQITDGAAYCVGFGGAAGGRVSNKGATSFKVSNPTAEACP